jgi:hypothetical protein
MHVCRMAHCRGLRLDGLDGCGADVGRPIVGMIRVGRCRMKKDDATSAATGFGTRAHNRGVPSLFPTYRIRRSPGFAEACGCARKRQSFTCNEEATMASDSIHHYDRDFLLSRGGLSLQVQHIMRCLLPAALAVALISTGATHAEEATIYGGTAPLLSPYAGSYMPAKTGLRCYALNENKCWDGWAT